MNRGVLVFLRRWIVTERSNFVPDVKDLAQVRLEA